MLQNLSCFWQGFFVKFVLLFGLCNFIKIRKNARFVNSLIACIKLKIARCLNTRIFSSLIKI